jgi:glycosyltransferase involved in cell wall biosynthesis
LSKIATTIVVSDLSKKIYEKLGYENVVAIPNGIDVSRLQSSHQVHGTMNHELFHIGTIARLSKDKGIDVLIDAVKDLSNIQVSIVGTGPEERSLQLATCPPGQWPDRTGNLPHITITPHIDELASFYTSLDLFVLPSREHDPFGLVAGEAMMMGVPVVVTDACGIASYLTDGENAVVIPAGSTTALQDAIRTLMNKRELLHRIADNGKRAAESQFSMEEMVKRYEKVLRQAL